MPFEADLDEVFRRLREIVAEAYEQGLNEGGERVRQSILAAAQTPMAFAEVRQLGGHRTEPSRGDGSRAPRGRVGELLGLILRDNPGLTIREVEHRVHEQDDRIATVTVGNTLRRLEGTLYRREGFKWFLLDRARTETAGRS